MQWDRAKNFMLVFFLLANIILAALIRYETGGHTLTLERESAILAVLEQNDIVMAYHIPRQFAPMRPLQVAPFYYDIERLLSVFAAFFPPYAEFDYTGSVRDDFRLTFEDENIHLTISNGYIQFVAGREHTGIPDRYAAMALTQAFIRDHFPDFRLDIHSTRQARRDGGGLRIFYRQEYQGRLIHANFVEFLVTGEGFDIVIEEVDIQYCRPIGFAYMPREIVGSDEALLAFVQDERRPMHPIVITHMDIVYLQISSGMVETYVSIYAEPFYRIFIEGQVAPFLINAYTNVPF